MVMAKRKRRYLQSGIMKREKTLNVLKSIKSSYLHIFLLFQFFCDFCSLVYSSVNVDTCMNENTHKSVSCYKLLYGKIMQFEQNL